MQLSTLSAPLGSCMPNWLQGYARTSSPRGPSCECSATSSEYHLAVLPHRDATLTTTHTFERNVAKSTSLPLASWDTRSKKDIEPSWATSVHLLASSEDPPIAASSAFLFTRLPAPTGERLLTVPLSNLHARPGLPERSATSGDVGLSGLG
eukprot:CAMPEP_0206164656 /NCGR_PEP_ID=MMETSP1474-20131121/17559_1 /ASSEMBLY_ACC=CAM_ASM_001110 /TAXON_ID=97495 /ORGANISM="Imantonia sp., Strain RCC918" /LENGTH=150 /DNA_ID=CAMNT_0053567651 /DNA_START=554 /DNA_END=1006 /DNA_ORIENTATION=-